MTDSFVVEDGFTVDRQKEVSCAEEMEDGYTLDQPDVCVTLDG